MIADYFLKKYIEVSVYLSLIIIHLRLCDSKRIIYNAILI